MLQRQVHVRLNVRNVGAKCRFHHGLQQLLGFAVQGALGAVDQHHLGGRFSRLLQPQGGEQGHHGPHRVADQMQAPAPPTLMVEKVHHLLGPEIEAIAHRSGFGGLIRQVGAGFVAGPEAQQIHRQHLGLSREGGDGVAPVAEGGAEPVDQQHQIRAVTRSGAGPGDAMAAPLPGGGGREWIPETGGRDGRIARLGGREHGDGRPDSTPATLQNDDSPKDAPWSHPWGWACRG